MEAVKSILRSSEIFSGLSESHLDLVASATKIREIAAGDYLFQQGDVRRACYVIAEGQVEVTRDNGDGPEPLILLGPGYAPESPQKHDFGGKSRRCVN